LIGPELVLSRTKNSGKKNASRFSNAWRMFLTPTVNEAPLIFVLSS
jgi:hypothetical protein